MGTLNRWLDRSLVFSFDRTGYRRHARSFSADEPERDLRGRPLLITGGTRGIGLAAAHALARRGARPILWSRDPRVGQAAAAACGGAFTSVDLGDLEAVTRAAAGVAAPLAGVVLNAGSMPRTLTRTAAGHEQMWASQVLGHLQLLRALRARGALAADARVVWVASGGLYSQRLGERPVQYQRHRWYAAAKRAQVVLSAALAERWPDLWMGAMHPGWVDTEALAEGMPLFRRLTLPVLRTPDQGADTIVWLQRVASPPSSGRFWFDRREAPLHLTARTHDTPVARAAEVEALFAATHDPAP